ncbi:MAG: endonuclease IV, partial [Candidatus Nanohaloarchaea archaeon]
RNVVNHPDLRDVPMVVETPENGKGFPKNIARVRDLRDHQ